MATYFTDLVPESSVSQGLAVFWFNILFFFLFQIKMTLKKMAGITQMLILTKSIMKARREMKKKNWDM
jgi:hypothetical protein